MATPKKKVSRSRRNMRRFSTAYKLDTVTWTTASAGDEALRPHTVTLETVDAYVAARSKRKSARSASASKS